MDRRKFIKKASIGFGSFMLFPSLVSFGHTATTSQMQLIPVYKNPGQIRHGLLQLPQFSTKTEALSFDWLKNISRNIFFKNGFGASVGKEDMEIASVLLEDKDSDWSDAIQIQQKQNQTIILTQEKEWECKHQQNEIILLQNHKNQAINFSFGNLNQSAKHLYNPHGECEVFVYLLAGKIKVNGQLLEENIGLGIKTNSCLEIKTVEDSQFVLMKHRVS